MSAHTIHRAAILAIGSEMLTPHRIDTNSLFITGALNAIGIDVVFKGVVGDDRRELAEELAHHLERVDVVVLTGGLGPTEDDVTRDVVAAHLDLPLVEDEEITAAIRRRFEARGWTMPEINRRQAMVPRGATVIRNANGTAPGLFIEHGDKALLLVPGPPREMKPMVEAIVAERLRPRTGGMRLLRKGVKIAGRSESRVEELTQPVYSRWLQWQPPIETTILAGAGQIELQLTTRTADEAQGGAALDRASAEIEALMPEDAFSTDGRTIEQVVGDMLRGKGWRIALAESCTGGLATSRLTDIAGSSAYVDASVVAYSNDAKTAWLDVPADIIAAHGAVSEPVARAMAEGVRRRAVVEVGVGITGIAGPGGGSETKPVGMVCIGVATIEAAGVRTFKFPGGREQVKAFASFTALDMVRRTLAGVRENVDWLEKI